jgi:hypothetical protein
VHSVLPHLKGDEVQLFLTLNDDNDLKELALAHGWDDKEVKELLK